MDSFEDLNARIAAATVSDQISGTSMNGLIGRVTEWFGEATAARFREEAEVPHRLIGPVKYPVTAFLNFARLAAEKRLQAGHPLEESLRSLGGATVETFFGSVAGRVMLAINGESPHRMLSVTPTAYKMVCTFGARDYMKISETSVIIGSQKDLYGPEIVSGVLITGLRAAAHVTATVEARDVSSEGRNFKLHINW